MNRSDVMGALRAEIVAGTLAEASVFPTAEELRARFGGALDYERVAYDLYGEGLLERLAGGGYAVALGQFDAVRGLWTTLRAWVGDNGAALRAQGVRATLRKRLLGPGAGVSRWDWRFTLELEGPDRGVTVGACLLELGLMYREVGCGSVSTSIGLSARTDAVALVEALGLWVRTGDDVPMTRVLVAGV